VKVYTQRPTQRRARLAWDYATKQRGKEPLKLWKNANCWRKGLGVAGNAWGWWIAEFDRDGFTDGKHVTRFEPIDPKELS
jgi:hypothetical protein